MEFENIHIQSMDEFNYTSVVNFSDKKTPNSGVLCLPGFEILFYNFKNIIISKLLNTKGILLDSDIDKKEKIFELLKLESLNISKNIFLQSDMNFNGKHVYEYMFSNLSKDMQTKKSALYLPKESDYIEIKNKLNHINKKIVIINGRNLNGNRAGRNNLMIELIKLLLQKNLFIINCTIPKPSLNVFFNSESYVELNENDLIDYSKNISYFVNADCVISVCNAGGITNHICCDANFILFGEGGWVDNKKFGYNNQSLYNVSKSIKPTYKTDNFYEIEFLLEEKLSKPIIKNFFDITKIKYYEL